ncbi:MAG: FHA domain-containing protein [Planctomycetota bacterium]|nr:MAG: FHA domain-containing protein [Planctomycetota bacterium]
MIIHLEVIQGQPLGHVYTIQDPEGEVVIGRSEKADIVLSDTRVSRRHAKLIFREDGVYLRDLESRNGTFHRTKENRISEVRLIPGDIFYLGLRQGFRFYAERDVRDTDVYCEECGERMNLPTYADGSVAEVQGQYLCKGCSKNLDVPEDMVEGYRILHKLGEGAMGSVYKAWWEEGERYVALKLLKFDEECEPVVIERFKREALTEGRLRHPNVVELYKFGFSQGYHYISLEYVEGRTLLDIVLEEGPLEVSQVLKLALEITDALRLAYQKRIVHRDIKPSNIMITSEGVAKLADFGLAKHFESAGLSCITMTGTGVGTPAYMPPEQVMDARSVDQRADIYSFGVTLYVALTGYRPFSARTTQEYLKLILTAKPMPVRRLKPEIPLGLARIVERAMEKEKERRYQTPEELWEALCEFRREFRGDFSEK